MRAQGRQVARPDRDASTDRTGWLIAGVILALAFVLRAPTFGDPALHTDEEFYFYVGQQMLDGRLPYVDIWDRKPFGLFAIYAAIAAISRSVVAYQVAACVSAAATAMLLTKMVGVRWPAALCIGGLYLVLVPTLGGFGGQAPIFYNTFIAGAAWLIVGALPTLDKGRIPWRVYAAMGVCGLALTIKQTVIAEAAFFGLYALAAARRGGMGWGRLAATLSAFAAIGALPWLAVGAFYASEGHWAEYYQAMVTSNFDKGAHPLPRRIASTTLMLKPLWLPIIAAGAGLAVAPRLRVFFGSWLLVAMAALFLVPNFYWHYGLPLLVPALCCMAFLFDRWPALIVFALGGGLWALAHARTFDVELHQKARANMVAAAQDIDRHGRTLFVYDGPVYLYAMTRAKPLSNIVLPWHLKEKVEDGVSGRSQHAIVAEILRRRPETVTFHDGPQRVEGTRAMVRDYVRKRCRKIADRTSYESFSPRPFSIYAGCR